MVEYTFREDAPLRIKGAKLADPQIIGEALDKIRVDAGGELEPSDVVKAARDTKHALHPYFEWDDAKAAEAFRVDQARGIIRVVRVVDDTAEDGTARAFISLNGRSGTSYRAVEDVRRSRDLQEIVLAQAERDLEGFQRRYRELADVCEFVRSARDAVRRRRVKQETRTAA